MAAAIGRFPGGHLIEMVDGMRCEADVVLLCTGYKRRYPFLDSFLSPADQVCSSPFLRCEYG